MRHREAVIKLGRTAAHRKAMLANLASALFERKHVQTTEAKAKAVRQFSERLITLAKRDTLHARRLALRRLRQKKIVRILFDDIAPQYVDRPGGYTRVIKLGQRQGDGARMAIIELVGFDTAKKKKREKDKEKAKAEAKKKKRVKAEEAEEAVDQEEAKEEKKPAEEKKEKADKEAEVKAKAEKKEKKEGRQPEKKSKKEKSSSKKKDAES